MYAFWNLRLTHLCLRLLFFTHLQYESTVDTYIPTYPNNRPALAAESLIDQWNPLPLSGINTFMADPSIFTFPNIRFIHSPVPSHHRSHPPVPFDSVIIDELINTSLQIDNNQKYMLIQ